MRAFTLKYIIFRFNPFFAWLYIILYTNVLPSSGLTNFFFLRTPRIKNYFNIFTLFNHIIAATATVVFGEIYNTIQINKMHHGNCRNIFMQIVKINSRSALMISKFDLCHKFIFCYKASKSVGGIMCTVYLLDSPIYYEY